MVMSGEGDENQSVLHVWNTAGVGSIIAKYQNRLFGWNTWVVMRKKFDRFGLTIYGDAWDCGTIYFYIKSLLKSLNYSLIHVHSLDKMVKFSKIIFPRKKVVLHYHGSDIRGRWKERRKYWEKADLILVSTLDLLEGAPEKATFLHNPVDVDFFHPMGISNKGTAFHISYNADDLAIKYAEENNLSLTIHDRLKNPINYIKFGETLAKYEYYVDIKRNNKGRILNAMSKTGLESLACGLKVIRWDDKVVEGLPEEHNPENAVTYLKEIY